MNKFAFFYEMIHQGWAILYPNEMGFQDDFSSVACKQMAKLACKNPGWWHPENTCPRLSSPGPVKLPLQGSKLGNSYLDCVSSLVQFRYIEMSFN